MAKPSQPQQPGVERAKRDTPGKAKQPSDPRGIAALRLPRSTACFGLSWLRSRRDRLSGREFRGCRALRANPQLLWLRWLRHLGGSRPREALFPITTPNGLTCSQISIWEHHC